MSFDSEHARLVDRIRATAFYEAKQAGADFITRKWVADKINRSESFVKRNWTKKPMDCFAEFSNCGRPESLSQESRAIINTSIGFQRKSCRGLSGTLNNYFIAVHLNISSYYQVKSWRNDAKLTPGCQCNDFCVKKDTSHFLLSELEFDNDLFESLLCSMPERLRQVREAEGGNTNF